MKTIKDFNIYQMSIELNGVSMIIAGLVNQMDNENCDSLTPPALDGALFAVRCQIERISKELEELDRIVK